MAFLFLSKRFKGGKAGENGGCWLYGCPVYYVPPELNEGFYEAFLTTCVGFETENQFKKIKKTVHEAVRNGQKMRVFTYYEVFEIISMLSHSNLNTFSIYFTDCSRLLH